MVEGIADWAVVGIVGLADSGDSARTQAVQPGVVETFKRTRIAGVGIDVDRATGRACADGTYRTFDEACLDQRLTLAALAEADDRIRRLFKVAHSHVNHLILGRHKEETILRRNEFIFLLLGDAADATSVQPGETAMAPSQ